MIIYTIFLNVISLSRLANASKEWKQSKKLENLPQRFEIISLMITEQEEEKHYLNFQKIIKKISRLHEPCPNFEVFISIMSQSVIPFFVSK
jgi:hypothetical protein